MNTSRLRRKRVLVPALATVAVLGAGGIAWAATADDSVQGGERDRVGAAATEAVGGTVVDVETGDDPGAAYEVEVRLDDGRELEVTLDKDLEMLSQELDDDQGRDDDDRDDSDDDGRDDDQVTLGQDQRAAVDRAALAAVEGGTVLKVERGDDPGEAYEVEVRDQDGVEWDVELDADLQVIRATQDD